MVPLSIETQAKVIRDLEDLLWKDFIHRTTGLEFKLIIGGGFEMGLSHDEEPCARNIDNTSRIEFAQMRPVHSVWVSAFLITKFPILDSFARNRIYIDPNLFRSEFGDDDVPVPIYLSKSEIQELTEQTGFSLPSEAQWEYARRGTTKSLFYFGNSLPDDETLESTILVNNFNDPRSNLNGANPFGLVGLSVGEWCKDTFQKDYSNARSDDLPVSNGSPYVVRSGAGPLWPWQDCDEWTLSMSAMRRSSDCLEDGTCGARLVKRLDLSER